MTTPGTSPIVCGFDFSDTARVTAKVAAMLANDLRVPLKLVFSREAMATGSTPSTIATSDDYYMDQLKETAHQLSRTGATVDPVMCQGSPYEALIAEVEKYNAQLLIVGWHGVNSRWRVGTVAEHSAEYSPTPTLVIRDAEVFENWLRKDMPLKTFVCFDFSYCSEAALRFVAALREVGPLQITATFIDKPTDELRRMGIDELNPDIQAMVEEDLREKVDEILGPNDAKVTTFGNWARKPKQLMDLAQQEEADLIVIGSHQWHGVDQRRHRSVSHDIIHHAPTNIVCVPRPKDPITEPPLVHRCQRVLAAVDLDEPNDFTASHAYSIVASGGEVVLLYNLMTKDPNHPLEQLKEQLKQRVPAESIKRGVRSEFEVTTETDHAKAICHAAERFNADVVCVGSHHRPGFKAKVLGSVSLAVLQKCQRPTLLIGPYR